MEFISLYAPLFVAVVVFALATWSTYGGFEWKLGKYRGIPRTIALDTCKRSHVTAVMLYIFALELVPLSSLARVWIMKAAFTTAYAEIAIWYGIFAILFGLLLSSFSRSVCERLAARMLRRVPRGIRI